MYLERVKAKGRYYLYLRMYDPEVTYGHDKRVRLYCFGREEKALDKMCFWLNNFDRLPIELKEIGCTEDDLKKWIHKLEERIRKWNIKVS